MNSKSKHEQYRMQQQRDDLHNNQLSSRRKVKIQDDRLTNAINSSLHKNRTVEPELDVQFEDTEEFDWMDSVYSDTMMERDYDRGLYEHDMSSRFAEQEYYAQEIEKLEHVKHNHGNDGRMHIENEANEFRNDNARNGYAQWGNANGFDQYNRN